MEPPAHFVRGRATTPVVHGKHIVWAENVKLNRRLNGGVLLYVTTTSGVIVERVPLSSGGIGQGGGRGEER